MATVLRTLAVLPAALFAALGVISAFPAGADSPLALFPDYPPALEIRQLYEDYTLEQLCAGPLDAGFPGNVAEIPPAGTPPAYPQPPGAAVSLDSHLEHQPLASRLLLKSVPSTGGGRYLLTVEIRSQALMEEVSVSLRLPAQVNVEAIDRELHSVAELSDYLALTAGINYRDYRIGNAAPIGKPGTRQFRFLLEQLPALGQIELRVSAKSIDHDEVRRSFSRLHLSDLRGDGTLFASPDLLAAVLEAERFQACENGDRELSVGLATLSGLVNYGGAKFEPDFSVTDPSTGEFCLQGSLRFSAVNGTTDHAVPGAAVHLVNGPAGFSAPLLSDNVDDEGHFTFDFDETDVTPAASAAALNLVFETQGALVEVFADNLHETLWGIGLFESAQEDLKPRLIPNQCVNIGTIIADSVANQENNYAFEIYSALQLSGQSMSTIGETQPPVIGVYPTPAASGLPQSVSLFQSDDGEGNPRIVVAPPDPHAWDTLYHEYGHFVQHAQGKLNPMPGVPHFIYQNHCDSKAKRQAIEFAWYEAWPTALGMVLQKQLPLDYLQVPSVGDGAYSGVELDGSFDSQHFDPAFMPLPSMAGEATEAVITAALWELYEDASFRDEYAEPAPAERILVPAASWLMHSRQLLEWHLSGFNTEKLRTLAGAGAAPAFDGRIGGLWSRHRVGPSFVMSGDSPAARLNSRWLFSLVNGPNCGGGAVSEDGIEYFMRVYAEDYQSIVWEGEPDDSPVVAIPVSELKSFLTGSGDTLHWHPVAVHPCEAEELALNAESDSVSCDPVSALSPQTGPYAGAGWTMVDDVAICPPWLIHVLAILALLLVALVIQLLRTGSGWIALLLVLLLLALLLYRYWPCLAS